MLEGNVVSVSYLNIHILLCKKALNAILKSSNQSNCISSHLSVSEHVFKKPMKHDPASQAQFCDVLVLLQLWGEETAVVLACLRHLTEQQMKMLQTTVVRQSYMLDR